MFFCNTQATYALHNYTRPLLSLHVKYTLCLFDTHAFSSLSVPVCHKCFAQLHTCTTQLCTYSPLCVPVCHKCIVQLHMCTTQLCTCMHTPLCLSEQKDDELDEENLFTPCMKSLLTKQSQKVRLKDFIKIICSNWLVHFKTNAQHDCMCAPTVIIFWKRTGEWASLQFNLDLLTGYCINNMQPTSTKSKLAGHSHTCTPCSQFYHLHKGCT